MISASGSFSDVDWDNNGLYDHNANSVWTIVADDDHVIKFDILSLSTEESNGACIYDYLKASMTLMYTNRNGQEK